MRHFKSNFCFLIILLQLSIAQLYSQVLPLQTLSLAADSYAPIQVDGLQMDWRLDLGPTSMILDQSNSYHFTAGFLQPIVNRFANVGVWEKYNPMIELKNTFRADAIILFSKEPDLILFGYKIMNMHGQILINDQTKYRSSYQGRSIDVHTMASGIYIMQILYLPEWMTMDGKTNYWVKYIKFIKP
jgi:hypothetical protein